MKKRILGLTLLVLMFVVQVVGQEKEIEKAEQPAEMEGVKKKGLDPERLYFGGNFGVTFGNFTFINISPQVGYRVSPIFSAGAGVNFIYQSDKYYSGSREVKNTLGYAGLNIFGRLNPYKFILLNAQPELNYVWGTTRVEGLSDSKIDPRFVPSFLVGVGASLPMGGRGRMIAMLQYDIIQDNLSPYGRNAFFTFGVNF
jgi:hypothetical protein